MIGRYFSLSPFPDGFVVDGFDDYLDPANISTQCPHGNPWVLIHFGQCISDTAQWASFVLGLISLVIWFFPALPQIYKNYKRGSVADALSPLFLLSLFFGDAMNLTGCILTKQLAVQVYVASYFMLQDFTILSQYVYYGVKNRWLKQRSTKDLDANASLPRSTLLNGLLLGGVFLMSGTAFFSKSILISNGDQDIDRFQSRTLLAPMFNGATDKIGYVCGALSAVSYLSGRVPQLLKNYKRQSTEGVAIATYVILCLGNTTYGTSVLLGCDIDPATYYARHAPWLVGSLGCLFLDSVTFVQYFNYKNSNNDDLLPIINDSLDEQSDSITDPSV